MKSILRWLLVFLIGGTGLAVALAAVIAGAYYYVEPSLPPTEELDDVQFQIPLRAYSRDGRLMQQFGVQKRTPVSYEDIPQVLIDALIAAEDDAFFVHSGVDPIAIVKAAFNYILVGGSERVPGGSTITQQVARYYFLSRDYSPIRKFREQILAMRIERELTKEEILELFFNTFFFGQQSYGVAAAAQTYFGKELSELTLSDAAILAGIPQGPSIHNPIYSPENAANRRAYVLRRMRELDFIDQGEYEHALGVPITGERHGLEMQLDAPYVAEMVRADMIRRFGPAALTAGFTVTTTLDSRFQVAAQEALRAGIVAYDERHGYRGPVARLTLPEDVPAEEALAALDEQALREALADYSMLVGLEAGLVRRVGETDAEVFLPSSGIETIGLAAVEWAAPYIDDDNVGSRPEAVSDVLSAGDIVRFKRLEDGTLRLAQLPDVQGALVAIDPMDGAITALAGGFDYYLDKYNRAVQAKRQPGSSMKPFVYSAALENGFTVATMINDAPIAIWDPVLETVYTPSNYGGVTYGWVSTRFALVHSLNLATLRMLQDAGVLDAVRHLQGFGFDDLALPTNLTLALGTGSVSPLDLAAGYAVFANGGFRVDPYFIDRIADSTGEPLFVATPAIACNDCGDRQGDLTDEEILASIDDVTDVYPRIRGGGAPRVITPQNAYLVADLMRDVVSVPGGTGVRARRMLERDDIAGKTGTTDNNIDTWFAGFHPNVVAVAWVGFNSSRPLGGSEQGARTAIPIWAEFMKEALEGVPQEWPDPPPGIINVRINPENGLRANGCSDNAVFEIFRAGHVPEPEPGGCAPSINHPPGTPDVPVTSPTDKIF